MEINSTLKKLYVSITKQNVMYKAFIKHEEDSLSCNLSKAGICISRVSSCIALDLPMTHRVHVVQA